MPQSVAVLSTFPRISHHLQSSLPTVDFVYVYPDQKETLLQLSKAEIVIADANLLVHYIDALSSAKWVQLTWAGIDLFIDQLREKKFSFTMTRFTGESSGHGMSEYVVSQIVNFERDQRLQLENQAQFLWSRAGKVSDHRRINDFTIGILGLGGIGKVVAKALKTFGAEVWGMSRSSQSDCEYIDRHVTTESLLEILENCDYIINVLPSTKETTGLLNGNILQSCSKRKPVFVNVGRGSIIKDSDLINAIEKNWISGAILDVCEEEPLPKNSKLWRFPQVIITPHMAAVPRAKDIAKEFVENYKRYMNGEKLKYVVDVNSGY